MGFLTGLSVQLPRGGKNGRKFFLVSIPAFRENRLGPERRKRVIPVHRDNVGGAKKASFFVNIRQTKGGFWADPQDAFREPVKKPKDWRRSKMAKAEEREFFVIAAAKAAQYWSAPCFPALKRRATGGSQVS